MISDHRLKNPTQKLISDEQLAKRILIKVDGKTMTNALIFYKNLPIATIITMRLASTLIYIHFYVATIEFQFSPIQNCVAFEQIMKVMSVAGVLFFHQRSHVRTMMIAIYRNETFICHKSHSIHHPNSR